MNYIFREFYGDNKESKPNNYCTWCDDYLLYGPDGWYETDDHLRERVKNLKVDMT